MCFQFARKQRQLGVSSALLGQSASYDMDMRVHSNVFIHDVVRKQSGKISLCCLNGGLITLFQKLPNRKCS